jgi:hypothetical protein
VLAAVRTSGPVGIRDAATISILFRASLRRDEITKLNKDTAETELQLRDRKRKHLSCFWKINVIEMQDRLEAYAITKEVEIIKTSGL